MLCWSIPVVFFLLLTQSVVETKGPSTVSLTVVPDETGSEVVDAVVNIITRNCIFPADQLFLRRLAIVESTDGRDIKNQTSSKYYGGIWKVDKDKFQQTKSLRPVLKPAHEQIRKNLNINWDQVKWLDLRKPLYSGLAATLYILLNTDKRGIPSEITEQASLWKTIYQTEAPTSIFLEKVSKLKLSSTLLDQHNRILLCRKHNGNINNIKAVSMYKMVHNKDAIANDTLKPLKTPPLQVNTIVRKMEIIEQDQNKPHNKSDQVGHKTQGILNYLCTKLAVKEQKKFQYPPDRKKYIICSAVSVYSIRDCDDRKYFNESEQTCTQSNCEIPIWVNQLETTPLDKSYPNPCKIYADHICDLMFVSHLNDPTKFIQCDKKGHAVLKHCPIDWIWNDKIKACFYRSEKCITPIWDNPNEVGMTLPSFYVNPCKVGTTRNCDYIYAANMMDTHKFIRCDRLGKALIKTCPIASDWDIVLNKCTEAIITTTKPHCRIPVWDNSNEAGIKLPEFYANPCKVDPERVCNYVYMSYMLSNHKFIRCDKLGEALVKSCPFASNWDSVVNECTNIGIITTETPVITTSIQECQIPGWDNSNEAGIKLPEFYANPCKVDPERICNYVYMSYMLSNHKFIRCDKLGEALVKSCPIASNWDSVVNECTNIGIITTETPVITTSIQECQIPGWDNSNEAGIKLPEFYANPCKVDPERVCNYVYMSYMLSNHKFIRCDKLGEALIKSCPFASNWDSVVNECTNIGIITTETPVITTSIQECQIPGWDNSNEAGIKLPEFYANPCKVDPERVCNYVYMSYMLSNHKFIRCDKLGEALVKSCPFASNWDSVVNECTNIGIITTETPVITTSIQECQIPGWDNSNEAGIKLPEFYANPCKVDPERVCNYVYMSYMLSNHKFIRCDKLGEALVKSCPIASNWDSVVNECTNIGIITTETPVITTSIQECQIPGWDNSNEAGIKLPEFYANPCKVDPERVCNYVYMSYMLSNHKFIRCDKLGEALVKSCPIASNWDSVVNECTNIGIITTETPVITTSIQECQIPGWDNSNEAGIKLPEFYANPCKVDPERVCNYVYMSYMLSNHKFIRCDKLGEALVKSCPFASNWDSVVNECTNIGIITTETPVITTSIQECQIPGWDNSNEAGIKLPEFYANPCKVDPERVCNYVYMSYMLSNHKFIRCDKLGEALVKSCPFASNWDSVVNECTNIGIITTETPVITTSIQECQIPGWDNSNEAGIKLPEFYANPCKVDPERVCNYVYMSYMLSNHKFIRCDKLGEALVKSCPIASNWDSVVNECTNIGIITTETPVITTSIQECQIPGWDNSNEAGIKLPEFYANPCKVDPERVCNYVYMSYMLSNHKFIRCDKLGEALVKSCPFASNWDSVVNECTNIGIITTETPVIITSIQECQIPGWDNSNEAGIKLPEFYANPCKVDPERVCNYVYMSYMLSNHKFIRCDKLGEALVKSCPFASNWDSVVNECTNIDIITTETPVITTSIQECQIPGWDNPDEVGSAMPNFYPNPCEADSARACNFIYVNFIIDSHKFIRCDRLGNALLKTCPTSTNWNFALNKCATVAIVTTSIPVITNPKSQCPIPVWDNPNEVGTALEDFYPNPCKADLARVCDYIYINHIIEDNKFIRCDRTGKALVKTCPISSNWDIDSHKCVTGAMIRSLNQP